MDKQIYLQAYTELGQLIQNNSKDYNKMLQLNNICKAGQDAGIKELKQIK